MNDPKHDEPAPREPARAGESQQTAAGNPPTPSQLTPEEQMALFEKDLKENDWGHQPC